MMLAEIEELLCECEYLFSRVRRLALRVGENPTPRWMKEQIGTTEQQLRKHACLGEDGPVATFQYLLQIKQELLQLEKRLRAKGGSTGDVSSEFFRETRHLPQQPRPLGQNAKQAAR